MKMIMLLQLYKRTSRRSSVAPAAAIAKAPAPVQEGVFARGCASWLDRCLGAAVLYRWNCGTSKITRLSFCHCAGVGEGVLGVNGLSLRANTIYNAL